MWGTLQGGGIIVRQQCVCVKEDEDRGCGSAGSSVEGPSSATGTRSESVAGDGKCERESTLVAVTQALQHLTLQMTPSVQTQALGTLLLQLSQCYRCFVRPQSQSQGAVASVRGEQHSEWWVGWWSQHH